MGQQLSGTHSGHHCLPGSSSGAGGMIKLFPMTTQDLWWLGGVYSFFFFSFVVSELGKGSKLVDCQYIPSVEAF